MLTVVNFVLIVVSKYLTTGEECLTIFLLQKSPVFAKISIRWSNNKTIAKVKMLKTVMFNLFFWTYTHQCVRNYLWKCGWIIPIFLSMRETCKIYFGKEIFIKSNHNKILFYQFKKRFWCYNFLSSGSPLQNCHVMDN